MNDFVDFLKNTWAGRKFRKIAKKATKRARRAVKAAFKAGTKTLLGTVIWVFIWVILIIGLMVFESTVPGMMINGIFDKFSSALGGIAKFFNGSNSIIFDENSEEIRQAQLDLLNYVQSMGFDVVQYGFVPDASINGETGAVEDFQKDLLPDEYIQKYNKLPTHSPIYRYVVAALRIYAINDDGIFGDSEQKGMLNIDKHLGQDLNIDYDNKRLEIVQTSLAFLGFDHDKFSFNLDGWSGRFGFPLDLSLSLHLATMSSDIVEELLANEDLQTMVNIDILRATADIEYILRNEDGTEIKYKKKNDKSLYQEYLKAGSNVDNMEISQDDVTIKGLVDLVYESQMETNMPTRYVRYNGEIIQYTTQFGGIKKCMEAMNALIGNGKFVCSNTNPTHYINTDIEVRSGTDNWVITRSPYICDLDENGQMNEETGILGVRLFNDAKEEFSYISYSNEDEYYIFSKTDQKGNTYYVDRNQDGSERTDWYYALNKTPGNNPPNNLLTNFVLDGLGSSNDLSLRIKAMQALELFDGNRSQLANAIAEAGERDFSRRS